MTDLEVADNAAKVIRCAVAVDKDQKFFSPEGRERAYLMRDHFERRVAELEATEKEAEEPDPHMTGCHVRIDELIARFDLHSHDTEGTTGPPT